MLLAPLIAILVFSFTIADAQHSPPNPGNFRFYEVANRHLAENMCPFLVLGDKKLPIVCWQCGFPAGLNSNFCYELEFCIRAYWGQLLTKSRSRTALLRKMNAHRGLYSRAKEDDKSREVNRYEYDCCPGFERSDLVDNKCVQMETTWKTIVRYLKERGNVETASALADNTDLPDLSQDPAKYVYTVFVPKEDGDIKSPEIDYRSGGNSARNLVTKGRHYARGFTNGRTIANENNSPLKITTYSNGAIPPSNRYPTVLSRLQSDPNLSQFVQALPSDVRSALDRRDSSIWYTVFAPTNRAWSEAVSRLPSGEPVANLARHHVLRKMLCARAITQESSSIGPTMADDYIRVTRTPNGKQAVFDACNEQIVLDKADLMSGTGVVHVIDKAIIPLGSMDLNDALQCLQRGPQIDLARAAREMEECNLASNSKAKLVLLPTAAALQGKGSENSDLLRRMQSDRSYRCKVYAYHLLTPDNPQSMQNPKHYGFVQEEKFRTDYTAPDGSPAYVTGSYVRERDGSKLSFNGATTTSLKPLKFRNGLIYPVESVNQPPEKSMMQLIRDEPNTIEIARKMQETGIQQEFNRLGNKVLFLAPIDMGWKTRDLENAYSTPQTRKLLQLHTIPHPMFGGENGFVWHSTILKVDSLLPDRSGGRVQLTIKRHPDGNTFIGHSELPEKLWVTIEFSYLFVCDSQSQST
ncbi:unnamed protein product [Echinostoma caproni]|uniref:FAS1 domain-containing protein n=1 Tax=Echinostoma caproni TaxID=27848 RepID=A0A183A9M2_9TREM|nr:unnamed protein product [Echinostoma caproni]